MVLNAKPFPSQLRIGADVAHIPRFIKLITKRLTRPDVLEYDVEYNIRRPVDLDHWARRVLSRLEWPRYQLYLDAFLASGSGSKDLNPKPLGTWLASRWAAKEAAIKAHTHRRLYMPQVAIIKEKGDTRPIMLIDPPNSLVSLSEDVASRRGINTEIKQKLDEKTLVRSGVPLAEIRSSPTKYWRYKKIRMEERQVADLSISHDGDYAFAVVRALDEPTPEQEHPEIFEDHGEGDPMHEPQAGDKGFSHYLPKSLRSKIRGESRDTSTDDVESFEDYMLKSMS